MSLNLVSPGIKVREIDLTVGRIDAVNEQIGAFVGPFQKGPVDVPVLVETEKDLLNTFGKPLNNDNQYEYWLSASSYLSYGGVLRVVRSDSSLLKNAHYPVSSPVSLKIKNQEDYTNNYSSATDWIFAAKDPGSWANGIKVCTIDAEADQRIAIGTFGISAGYAITCGFTTDYATSSGTVSVFSGFVKGIVSKVNEGSIDVKIVSLHNSDTGLSTEVSYTSSGLNRILGGANQYWQVFNNVGTATSLEKIRLSNSANVGVGSTVITSLNADIAVIQSNSLASVGDLIQTLNGALTARITGITTTEILIDTASPVSFAATTLVVRYAKNVVDGTTNKGEGLYTKSYNTVVDWYEQQTLNLTNNVIYWKSIAPKPGTSQYCAERGGKNDEIHVVVVDDAGSVTGVSGNILEKYTNLSKGVDAKISPSENIYYKNYLANVSSYVFAGTSDSLSGNSFTSIAGYVQTSGGTIAWGQNCSGVNFGSSGNKSYSLAHGYDYSSATGGMSLSLSDVLNSYEIFRNPAEYDVNFLIAGPDGGSTVFEAQAKANRLIDIAEARKDCIACISPRRSGIIGVSNSDTQTTNIINFFDSVTSSSYAVFDSGYKYMFDRFNNEFRYVPLNADIAGLMARTSINNYAWFSPAGAARGVINNAIKLAYNPSQSQRDLLYPKRINPVIFSPGAGIILFGDKTGLAQASAFDRINVRRLFLTVEDTISRAAKAQLFEFNDVITRSNFVNIVEPYLRDVKSKRGITDFLVVCDESNNTPDVIDANQFRADIFIKPARSINFIGLTFVANRTGISFEEVVGTV
jgi:hypothetical protein